MQRHGQRFRHIRLNGGWYGRILIGGTNKDASSLTMLELAGPSLNDFGPRDEREYDICGESLFQIRLNAETMGCVDEDTGMLRRNYRFDDGGDIVHVRQSLYAEQDVIEGSL